MILFNIYVFDIGSKFDINKIDTVTNIRNLKINDSIHFYYKCVNFRRSWEISACVTTDQCPSCNAEGSPKSQMQFWPPWQWSLLDNSRNSFHMYSLEKVLAYFFIDLHIFDCSFFFYSCDNFSVIFINFLLLCTYAHMHLNILITMVA